MICNVCGRSTMNESANFCEYCGSSFRGKRVELQFENNSRLDNHDIHTESGATIEKPISMGQWLGSMLLLYIPIIGMFIYPVMLFVWSFSSTTPKSKQNWARASLILFILAVFIFVYFMTSAYTEMVSGGFNFNDYMQPKYY